MAVGALKTLLSTLKASAYLTGVNVAFGEEALYATDLNVPYIVVVPRGGQYTGPGYISGQDASVEMTWETRESVDVYIWGASVTANIQPIDHADAVETLRQSVLSAFQDQRNQSNTDGSSSPGLYWRAMSGRWETAQGEFSRYGRCYVLTLFADISIPMASPVEATVTSISVGQSITSGQHVA